MVEGKIHSKERNFAEFSPHFLTLPTIADRVLLLSCCLFSHNLPHSARFFCAASFARLNGIVLLTPRLLLCIAEDEINFPYEIIT